MTAPNGLVEVGSLLVEAIVPAGEASTVEELTYARVAYLHAAHSPEPTSRDPVLDVRISRVDRLAASCTHRDSCSISMRDILPVPGTFGPASLWIPPGRLDLSRGATRRSERIALGSLRSAIAGLSARRRDVRPPRRPIEPQGMAEAAVNRLAAAADLRTGARTNAQRPIPPGRLGFWGTPSAPTPGSHVVDADDAKSLRCVVLAVPGNVDLVGGAGAMGVSLGTGRTAASRALSAFSRAAPCANTE